MSGNQSENNRPTPIFNLRSEPSNPLNAQLHIFDDISNTLPEEYREYARSREDLISLFNGTYDSLCRGEIGEGYIKDKVSASNIMIGYCIEGETENNGNNNYYTTIKPLGLLLGRYMESNNIIIDLICTDQEYKGVGKQLISIIKEIAAAKGISSLQLSSVKPAKSFYTKYNFLMPLKTQLLSFEPLTQPFHNHLRKSSWPRSQMHGQSVPSRATTTQFPYHSQCNDY